MNLLRDVFEFTGYPFPELKADVTLPRELFFPFISFATFYNGSGVKVRADGLLDSRIQWCTQATPNTVYDFLCVWYTMPLILLEDCWDQRPHPRR